MSWEVALAARQQTVYFMIDKQRGARSLSLYHTAEGTDSVVDFRGTPKKHRDSFLDAPLVKPALYMFLAWAVWVRDELSFVVVKF